MSTTTDILMITYNRPEYTRLSLPRLLETCDESSRVWLWHNGRDEETLEVVTSLAHHPRVYEFHHSRENKLLREPTNWLWKHAKGDFLSKVDDDCLMPDGWLETLRQAHEDVPEFGVIACWHFRPEDFVPELAQHKIASFPGGHQLMRNCWVGGSGYLIKRQGLEQLGLLNTCQTFSHYCIALARHGWVNGWYFPFLYQDHMDDPRSPHSLLRTDQDVQRCLPLSAVTNGVTTLRAWQSQLKRSARLLQQVPIDPRQYSGWRRLATKLQRRIWRLCGNKQQW